MNTASFELTHSHALVAYGNFLFKYRNRIFPIVLLALCFAFAPNLAAPSLAIAGYAIAAAGLLLRAAVIGFAYIKRGGLNKKVYADTLVTTGFFAVCRNPLYVGNVMIYAGLLMIHGHIAVILLGMAFFVTAYIAIIAAEEHYLQEKFGQAYLHYCANVPRWSIRLSKLPRAISGMRFDVRKVIYKDYTTIATMHAQAFLLFAYRDYTATGTVVTHWLVAIPAIALLALMIRVVKKRVPL